MRYNALVFMALTAPTNLVAAWPIEWNGKEAEAIAKLGSVVGATGYFGTRIYNQDWNPPKSSSSSSSSTKSNSPYKRQNSGDSKAPSGGEKAADIAGDTLTGLGLGAATWESAIKAAKAWSRPANHPPLNLPHVDHGPPVLPPLNHGPDFHVPEIHVPK